VSRERTKPITVYMFTALGFSAGAHHNPEWPIWAEMIGYGVVMAVSVWIVERWVIPFIYRGFGWQED
jgi:hypothetical protein